MPEKVLKKLNSYILPQWKACFYSAVLIGLMAHLYKIVNWLPNWDSLVFRYDPQNMLGLGRWFLPVVTAPTSFYDLPFLNGILAILFHGLGAVCVCRILGVRRRLTAALIGGVIASFPTVTSVMMYNYVADGYAVAFLLATLAAFLLTKEKPRYLLGALLLALSMGIYQAYVTVTIMLILLKLIDGIIFEQMPLGVVLKKAGLMLLTGILGVAIYFGCLKLLLAVFSMNLMDYQGINSTASLSSINLLDSLYVIKETFLGFFFDFSQGVHLFPALNLLIFAITAFLYVKYIVENKVYRKLSALLLVGCLGILTVLGAGALAFINASVDYHNLMRMGYAVFYLFFLLLYERGEDRHPRHTLCKRWGILLAAAVLIANQTVIANVSYHKAQIAYEKSYGVLVRIADRIDETPGTEGCRRIMVLGALDNSRNYSVQLPPDITGITDGFIIRADDETVGQSVLCSALNDYCDKSYTFLSGEEKDALAQREEVRLMAEWPKTGCVAVVEDTIVLKLGKEGENK